MVYLGLKLEDSPTTVPFEPNDRKVADLMQQQNTEWMKELGVEDEKMCEGNGRKCGLDSVPVSDVKDVVRRYLEGLQLPESGDPSSVHANSLIQRLSEIPCPVELTRLDRINILPRWTQP
jgi:hypothetical protein